MAESSREAEQGDLRQKVRELIEKTDQQTSSPEYRANMILEYLRYEWPDLTDWDLTCFASNWLAAMAIGPMPWLLEHAKKISNMVHKQHYLMGGREEHDKTKIDQEARENAANEETI